MKPLFTIHAGEYLVGSYIEEHFREFNVWLPSKDTGVDLLVTNKDCSKSVALQVKFSKDFSLTKTPDYLRQEIIARGWWTPQRARIAHSRADFWVLVLHNIHYKKVQYIIIKPKEYLYRLTRLHGKKSRIHTYLAVTKKKCWETRGLKKRDFIGISEDSYKNHFRDFSKYLNNWGPIKNLLK